MLLSFYLTPNHPKPLITQLQTAKESNNDVTFRRFSEK